MKLRRGEAIRWAGTGSSQNPASEHVFVCLDVIVRSEGEEYILVPICTAHDKSDGTCPLEPSDYSELKHGSYAAYYQARFATEQLFIINKAFIRPAKRVAPIVWARMRQGILTSEETPPKIVRALKTIMEAEKAAKAAPEKSGSAQ